MGPLGWQETVFIFFLALILFGPKKLPELGRTLGKAMTEFRRASNELKATFDREMKTLEAETESLRDVAVTDYHSDTYNYDYSSYETNYEGAYGASETYDSSATEHPSIASASAPEGAESPSAVTLEGSIARGAETVVENGAAAEVSKHSDPAGHASAPTAEHNA
jgi:TatA/E family protein of Tat protein translocase